MPTTGNLFDINQALAIGHLPVRVSWFGRFYVPVYVRACVFLCVCVFVDDRTRVALHFPLYGGGLQNIAFRKGMLILGSKTM